MPIRLSALCLALLVAPHIVADPPSTPAERDTLESLNNARTRIESLERENAELKARLAQIELKSETPTNGVPPDTRKPDAYYDAMVDAAKKARAAKVAPLRSERQGLLTEISKIKKTDGENRKPNLQSKVKDVDERIREIGEKDLTEFAPFINLSAYDQRETLGFRSKAVVRRVLDERSVIVEASGAMVELDGYDTAGLSEKPPTSFIPSGLFRFAGSRDHFHDNGETEKLIVLRPVPVAPVTPQPAPRPQETPAKTRAPQSKQPATDASGRARGGLVFDIVDHLAGREDTPPVE